MQKQPIIYRQGDVALVEMDKVPDLTERGKEVVRGRVVLALGEITGHSHVLAGEVAEFVAPSGARMVWVEAPAEVVHQEHAAIEILPGWYWVQQQREYQPDAIRNVAD